MRGFGLPGLNISPLQREAHRAYTMFLKEITNDYYGVLRHAVNRLAIADCLFSLAQVALGADYSRPEFIDGDVLEIVDGRHPIIERLSSDPFVKNSLDLGFREPKSKIITGPNMGGYGFLEWDLNHSNDHVLERVLASGWWPSSYSWPKLVHMYQHLR